MNKYSVNSERLWQSLMDMGKVGPGVAGGNKRIALSEADRQCRNLLVRYAKTTGCALSIDAINDIVARCPIQQAHS